jgi:membrane protease YdiL (CAAX protease family)
LFIKSLFICFLVIWQHLNSRQFFDNEDINIIIINTINNSTISINNFINLNNLYSIILAPIAEELMFFGFIFAIIYKINKPAAYIASISIFAANHIDISIIAAILGGIISAVTYAKTKNLTLCMVLHSIHNNLIEMTHVFRYKTNLIFDKDGYAYGFYNTTTLIIFAIITVTSFILLCCFSAKRHIAL